MHLLTSDYALCLQFFKKSEETVGIKMLKAEDLALTISITQAFNLFVKWLDLYRKNILQIQILPSYLS